jgi:hypothetical protein
VTVIITEDKLTAVGKNLPNKYKEFTRSWDSILKNFACPFIRYIYDSFDLCNLRKVRDNHNDQFILHTTQNAALFASNLIFVVPILFLD